MGDRRRKWQERRRKWQELPPDKKLAVIVPVLIALVTGVLVPVLLSGDDNEPERPSKLHAELSNVDVESGITLAEFSDRHELALAPPADRGGARTASSAGPVPGKPARPISRQILAGPTTHAQASPQPPDTDGDGIADDADRCPAEPAPDTSDGCPTSGGDADADEDGIPDGVDRCDDKAAPNTSDGCPTSGGDADADGIADDADRCPAEPAPDTSDGCLRRAQILEAGDCEESEFDRALRAPEGARLKEAKPACTGLSDLAQGTAGGDSEDPAERAEALLAVLRATRTRIGADGRLEALGVAVSFEVTLEGFKGRQVDVRWSLYRARDGGRVPRPWLVNHRVLRLEGEADSDTAGSDFWVPLPKLRGPFFVGIRVYDDNGTRLTSAKTRAFR